MHMITPITLSQDVAWRTVFTIWMTLESGHATPFNSQAQLGHMRSSSSTEDQRKAQVLYLHQLKSGHYVDNLFSFVTGNMAVVCWVLGAMYYGRTCEKPLAAFLLVLGCLAPFAACMPILMRQWFYLDVRLNGMSIGILAMSMAYFVWLFIGQGWAFASSKRNCDEDLCVATNAIVFSLYLVTLLYTAKVVWYVALRVRYRCPDLLRSCISDPHARAHRVANSGLNHDCDPDENDAPISLHFGAPPDLSNGVGHVSLQPYHAALSDSGLIGSPLEQLSMVMALAAQASAFSSAHGKKSKRKNKPMMQKSAHA